MPGQCNRRQLNLAVLVYSTPACPFCKKTKDLLLELGVLFENIDVSSNKDAAKDMIAKTGQIGVPVIDIDGRIILGFDRDEIIAALKAEKIK
jgi:glutaredoxin 3